MVAAGPQSKILAEKSTPNAADLQRSKICDKSAAKSAPVGAGFFFCLCYRPRYYRGSVVLMREKNATCSAVFSVRTMETRRTPL